MNAEYINQEYLKSLRFAIKIRFLIVVVHKNPARMLTRDSLKYVTEVLHSNLALRNEFVIGISLSLLCESLIMLQV